MHEEDGCNLNPLSSDVDSGRDRGRNVPLKGDYTFRLISTESERRLV